MSQEMAAILAAEQNMQAENERLKLQHASMRSEMQALLDEKGRAPMETDTSAVLSTVPPAVPPTARSSVASNIPVPITPEKQSGDPQDTIGGPSRHHRRAQESHHSR